jgi:hypothetical protein
VIDERGAERDEFHYYVVESSFVARVGRGTTERLTRDGAWVPYDDRWDVLTGGRLLADEAAALRKASLLFAEEDRRG